MIDPKNRSPRFTKDQLHRLAELTLLLVAASAMAAAGQRDLALVVVGSIARVLNPGHLPHWC